LFTVISDRDIDNVVIIVIVVKVFPVSDRVITEVVSVITAITKFQRNYLSRNRKKNCDFQLKWPFLYETV